jgi:hypothetical protein
MTSAPAGTTDVGAYCGDPLALDQDGLVDRRGAGLGIDQPPDFDRDDLAGCRRLRGRLCERVSSHHTARDEGDHTPKPSLSQVFLWAGRAIQGHDVSPCWMIRPAWADA